VTLKGKTAWSDWAAWAQDPILLLGGHGQVGTELQKLLAEGPAKVVAPLRPQLDLTDADALRATIRAARPRWILNAAAYTAVDRAESEPELAYAINARAVAVIGEEARVLGAAVVHFSTDYVFDGAASTPRRESDPTHPAGVYGASKLAGEEALAATGAAFFIFRTSWVYAAHGKNFMLTMLRLAGERDEIRVVADQFGAPTSARDLARLVHHAISVSERVAASKQLPLEEAMVSSGGLYHACNSGETSWFGFASRIIDTARARHGLTRPVTVRAITTAEYPTPARRPAYSRLDCTLLGEKLGYTMPSWEDSLEATLAEFYAGRPR
jgi:dTDP-4-dehydrorhamnose reductase